MSEISFYSKSHESWKMDRLATDKITVVGYMKNKVFGENGRRCKLCGSDCIDVIYHGVIRAGGLGKYTEESVPIFQCGHCGVIWHDPVIEKTDQYYESTEYRTSMDELSTETAFYQNHDKETLDKFQYTGTTIFRNKTVADIGCGAGAFLDFLKGVAENIIAVEPSQTFQKILCEKGFSTYGYAKDALSDWKNRVDVVTSFDVIEHVEDPFDFLRNAYDLASSTGVVITGTPTDAPIMRRLLGIHYEKQILFSMQHLWIFSKENLELMAKKIGFRRISIRYFQRYGLENLLGWCLEKKPRADIDESFFRNELDPVWRGACSAREMSDYIVLYGWK